MLGLAGQVRRSTPAAAEVRENQCFLKCNADPSAPGCANYAAFCASNTAQNPAVYPECFSGSNTICVEMPQDLEDMCNAVRGEREANGPVVGSVRCCPLSACSVLCLKD